MSGKIEWAEEQAARAATKAKDAAPNDLQVPCDCGHTHCHPECACSETSCNCPRVLRVSASPLDVEKPPTKPDAVHHPTHYNAHPSGIEAITICEHYNFNVGNAVKYLWRAGLKGDALEDLKKARWYVEREIERVSREKKAE